MPIRHRNSFVYDADSRQTVAIDPLGHRTSYQFDAASRQTLRIDARGDPNELCLRQR